MFEGFSFLEILIVGLIGLLFFKETMLDWVSRKLGFKAEEKLTLEPMLSPPSWANVLIENQVKLATHFNEETTEELKKISEGQDGILDLMREHNKLDERVITMLENFDKYGIPCRNEKS